MGKISFDTQYHFSWYLLCSGINIVFCNGNNGDAVMKKIKAFMLLIKKELAL